MNKIILTALIQNLIMLIIPAIFSLFLGIIIGSLLYISKKGQIKENKIIYYSLNFFVNFVRSFPFLIFVFVLIPVTRFIVGTAFGPVAASFPISIVAIALFSRFVEMSFYDVNPGIVDVARMLGANTLQIIWNFLIKESRSSLVLGYTSTLISIIAYTTVMGIVGGGGIGDLAINYGYYEYNFIFIYKMVLILSIFVFSIQILGNYISKKLDKKRREY